MDCFQNYLDDVAAPLNLPPRFQQLQTGRVLTGFNVSEEVDLSKSDFPWIVSPAVEVKPPPTYWDAPKLSISINDAVDKYREIFHEVRTNNPLARGTSPYHRWPRGTSPYHRWPRATSPDHRCTF